MKPYGKTSKKRRFDVLRAWAGADREACVLSTAGVASGEYEVVIGLEVHAQMLTATKIFCGCPTAFGSGPNMQTCPVCIGMPGVLPVLNEKALEFTVRTGLATGCKVSPLSRFARKNYFYPDLPKGYQISQYDLPICEHGHITISGDEWEKKVGITRIHMEEDAGKNIHEGGEKGKYSFVDLNRTGVPLMEIVSEPDMSTPEEAALYMKKLRAILRYLGVCDGNMEQGSLRCDANISIRPKGAAELGTKVEIKNINSFRFVEKALEYEIQRQVQAKADREEIRQETRLWNSETNVTESMRSKEEAHDYRYFPDPDLVPIKVPEQWVREIRESLPELPDAKEQRFASEFGLSAQDAAFLTAEAPIAAWFEEAVKLGGAPRAVSTWVMGDLTKMLKDKGLPIEQSLLTPAMLVGMLALEADGTISGKIAKTVFAEMFDSGKDAPTIVREKGLVQITDTSVLQKAVDEVVEKNPGEAERFRGGEQKLMGFFVGQVMKLTKGKANPKAVNELLTKKLSGK